MLRDSAGNGCDAVSWSRGLKALRRLRCRSRRPAVVQHRAGRSRDKPQRCLHRSRDCPPAGQILESLCIEIHKSPCYDVIEESNNTARSERCWICKTSGTWDHRGKSTTRWICLNCFKRGGDMGSIRGGAHVTNTGNFFLFGETRLERVSAPGGVFPASLRGE